MSKQTRRMSFIESTTNIVVGFALGFGMNIVLIDLVMGQHVPLWTNLSLTAVYTAISIVRSYSLRRLFENIRAKQDQTNAAN